MIKYISLKITLIKYIVKPLIAGIIMGAAAVGIYRLVSLAAGTGFTGNLIATLTAIVIAAAVYVILIAVLKILDRKEIEMLPGGAGIYRLLCKIGLYK